jgi:hypothetical protein
MAKFDFKKAILENKATFFGSLNEGQFSWFTQDTDQQIGSEPENTLPFVYMHDNKGNKWLEKNYDGYGEFGGKDYYELLDQMNGGDGDRSRGIDLAFDKEAVATGKILFPALTVSATLPSYHSFNEEPKNDPNQSWYTPEEDDFYDQNDEEEYGYDEDYDEEELDEAELPVLTADQVKMIAQQVADKFSATDDLDIKFLTTPGSVEADPKGAGFDLDTIAGPNTPGDDWKDENGFTIDNYLGKYAGGSYYIKPEGGKHKIYNAAAQNAYIGHVTPQGEVVFEIPGFEGTIDQLNFLEEEKPKTKMKKSELKELIKSSIMNEVYLDIDNMEDAPESEVDFLAEVDAILAEADKVKEGVWSVVPARIPEFIKAIENIKEEYHGIVGSDDVYNGLDAAISAAEELLMNTAEINEADEEVAVDDTEVAVDGEENINVDTTIEVDPNVKAVQDSLTQAQAAAQKLGDPKLTDQIGNTITFFTRAHVVDKGAVAEELNEVKSLLFSFDYNTDEDDVDYIQGLLKDARVNAIAQPGLESGEMIVKAKNEVELRKAKKVIQANGFKIYKSVEEGKEMVNEDLASALTALIISIIAIPALPITGALLMGLIDYLFNDLPDQRAEAKSLRSYKGPDKQEKVLALAKEIEAKLSPGKKRYLKTLVNRIGASKLEDKAREYRELDRYASSEKSRMDRGLNENLKTDIESALEDLPIPTNMEEDKKEYYKDAESDDAAHINALEKDMKDDKKSSMNEVMFPMLKRILK